MTQAILIGFSYTNTSRSLDGTCVDLYQVYRYCRKAGIPKTHITVITDLTEDISSGKILRAIADDIVDVAIGTFIEDIRRDGTYVAYRPLSFIDHIRASLKEATSRCFVYYTGHGISSGATDTLLLMPDSTAIQFHDLHRAFLSRKDLKDLFFIYDCCHAFPNDIPYKYQQSKASTEPRSGSRFGLVNPNATIRPNMMCICACSQYEKAKTTHLGSLFTRHLIQLLRKGVQSLEEISSFKGVAIYSAYPLPKTIPGWIIGTHLGCRIQVDPETSCLRVSG